MMKEELEAMRKELSHKLNCNTLNSDNILKLSQQLDKLIVEFYKCNSYKSLGCEKCNKNKGGSLC